jgi:hypothetical protein
MEKKTAVEWLQERISIGLTYEQEVLFEGLFHQAKEMEKKQKGYSEEEVIELLTQRCKYFGTSVSPFNKILLKQDLEWFKQFKKK